MSMNSLFLEQNCDYSLKHCNWLGVEGGNCALRFCNGYPSTSGTCPGIGLDPKNCCGSSDPATCINNWVHGGASSGSSGSSGPCASVAEVLFSCSSATPSLFPSGTIYTAGPYATAAASCLCYDSSGADQASAFDTNASECVASGSAAHPTYYRYASVMDGFCSNVAGPASTPATVTMTGSQTGPTGNATSMTGNETGVSTTITSAVGPTSSATSSGQSKTSAASFKAHWKSSRLILASCLLFAVSVGA